jgi:hypothetical protein
MEHLVFTLSLIIDGATEKVLQSVKPLKSIYTVNFGLIEPKSIFEMLKQEKIFKNTLFCWNILQYLPFQSCPL